MSCLLASAPLEACEKSRFICIGFPAVFHIYRSITLERKELLRAVYRAVDWARLYEIAPGATREDVDALFRLISDETESGQLDETPAEPVSLPLPDGWAAVYCDGASRGNPGPAGIGVVIESPPGIELASWGRPIGETTCNVAEYTALLEGVEKAKSMGIKKLEIRTDSQLMARQLTGRYRVKSGRLKPLFERVRAALSAFDAWKVKHIDRQLNKKADKLASAGASGKK